MSASDQSSAGHTFQVSSRLPLLLGDELIPDAGYALFELVKNAHDADATLLTVEMLQVDDKKRGKIVVFDDGIGMSMDVLTNVWLVLGTSYQRDRVQNNVTTRMGRTPLGAKGVGRFAAHKLGDNIQLVTRPSRQDYGNEADLEYVVSIDWTDFDDPEYEGKLGNVPVKIVTREPELIVGDDASGTRIEITELRESWTRGQVRQLHRILNSISSPFEEKGDFNTILEVYPQNYWLSDLVDFETIKNEALFTADVRLSGADYEYEYLMHDFPELEGRIKGRALEASKELTLCSTEDEDSLAKGQTIKNSDRKLSKSELEALKDLGDIELKLFMYDLTPELLDIIKLKDRAGLKKFLTDNGGIRVYRGGMRVFGLGGTGEDWLNLGGRRVQEPSTRLGNNLIIGALSISAATTEDMPEQTNRRGFVENLHFRTLKKALLQVITQIEADRKHDKDRLKQVLSGRKVKTPVLDEIADLRTKLEKKVSEKDMEELGPALLRVEKSYTVMRNVLISAAGSGLSMGVVVHEAEKRVGMLKNELKAGSPDMMHVRTLVDDLDQMFGDLTYLFRTKKHKKESLREIAERAIRNLRFRFDYHGVNLHNGFETQDDIQIQCSRRLIVATIINLIDNAFWWLNTKGGDSKDIYVGPVHDLDNQVGFVISDNGPGITDSTEDIIKPFFTRKPDSMGFGLYLASEVMSTHDGKLAFPMAEELGLPEMFDGATVALLFGRGDER